MQIIEPSLPLLVVPIPELFVQSQPGSPRTVPVLPLAPLPVAKTISATAGALTPVRGRIVLAKIPSLELAEGGTPSTGSPWDRRKSVGPSSFASTPGSSNPLYSDPLAEGIVVGTLNKEEAKCSAVTSLTRIRLRGDIREYIAREKKRRPLVVTVSGGKVLRLNPNLSPEMRRVIMQHRERSSSIAGTTEKKDAVFELIPCSPSTDSPIGSPSTL